MAHNDSDGSNAPKPNDSPKPILAASAMLFLFSSVAIMAMQPGDAHQDDTYAPADTYETDRETDVSSDDPGVYNMPKAKLLMLACKNPCNSKPCCGLIPEEVL